MNYQKVKNEESIATLSKNRYDLMQIEKMKVAENQKWFYFNGFNVALSCLQLNVIPKDEILYDILETLYEDLILTSSSMFVLLIFELENEVTYEYQIQKDCIKEIVHATCLSCEKDIIPLIENRYAILKNNIECARSFIKKYNTTISTIENYTSGKVANDFELMGKLLTSYITYCDNSENPCFDNALVMAKSIADISLSDFGISVTKKVIDKNIENNLFNDSTIYGIYGNDKEYVCRIFLRNSLNDTMKRAIVSKEIFLDVNNLL